MIRSLSDSFLNDLPFGPSESDEDVEDGVVGWLLCSGSAYYSVGIVSCGATQLRSEILAFRGLGVCFGVYSTGVAGSLLLLGYIRRMMAAGVVSDGSYWGASSAPDLSYTSLD